MLNQPNTWDMIAWCLYRCKIIPFARYQFLLVISSMGFSWLGILRIVISIRCWTRFWPNPLTSCLPSCPSSPLSPPSFPFPFLSTYCPLCPQLLPALPRQSQSLFQLQEQTLQGPPELQPALQLQLAPLWFTLAVFLRLCLSCLYLSFLYPSLALPSPPLPQLAQPVLLEVFLPTVIQLFLRSVASYSTSFLSSLTLWLVLMLWLVLKLILMAQLIYPSCLISSSLELTLLLGPVTLPSPLRVQQLCPYCPLNLFFISSISLLPLLLISQQPFWPLLQV